MMKIPVSEPSIGEKELEKVTEACRSGWISSLGGFISEFEERFSRYCGVRYGVTTTSGTTALHLALAALDLGPGDEVITPTFTMIATINAILYTGAKPVLVDSEPTTWNMDPEKVAEKLTEKTRAILPVHIYGHPVDMDPILELAKARGLYVIEDAAEAHGAEYKGKRAGGIGEVGCFSFYANKIITTGEGGMVVTDDEAIADKARRLKDLAHSKEQRFLHDLLGFNYRMTNLQAAVGVAQMDRIDELVEVKRRNAALYNELLKEVKGIRLPREESWAKHVYWMYAILVEDEFGVGRDELMRKLREQGIETRSFFIPAHQQPVYQKMNLFQGESYPVAEEISRRGFYLPSGLTLTVDQIEYVCEAVKDIRKEAQRVPSKV